MASSRVLQTVLPFNTGCGGVRWGGAERCRRTQLELIFTAPVRVIFACILLTLETDMTLPEVR